MNNVTFHLNIITHLYILFFFFGSMTCSAQQDELGMGFFTPNTEHLDPLYLYDIPNTKVSERPIDSITFKRRSTTSEVEIDYSPSYFNPFHEKLDYGVFIIRVKRLGRTYTEIFVDEESKRTAYVYTYQGNFTTWGEFLLGCHSVEFKEAEQKVFDNPMIKSAGRVADPPYFRPRYIMGDWMEVELLDNDYNKEIGKGWIRWKKDGKLLITYNLFA